MVKYFDISNWEEHLYYNTGGTRDKEVVENPDDGNFYYFKTSLKKQAIDYKYEFWSEILASELRQALGFNILHYDVAKRGEKLGCLSKSMVDPQIEELQEGYKWLTGFEKEYSVCDKEAYTFQIIEKLLLSLFRKQGFINDIIKIIVFDSIIGNEDRHQENWSIIVTNKSTIQSKLFHKKRTEITYSFAPIYDSGSSMGRELTDERVIKMLKDNMQLEAYINRGKSEIHWEGERGKQKHLELITKVANSGYREMIIEIINAIRANYRIETLTEIVNNIDNCLPDDFSSHKIPNIRKDFWIKLVTLRIEQLFRLQL